MLLFVAAAVVVVVEFGVNLTWGHLNLTFGEILHRRVPGYNQWPFS
jgi:hypothetical protein